MRLAPFANLDSILYMSILWSIHGQDHPDINETNIYIQDPARYVLPFIGTVQDGHVFPGATLPHGMVKVGMDTDAPGNHAGYDGNSRYKVTGFSQMHDSGTGGGVPLSNFKLFPLATWRAFEDCQANINNRKILRKVVNDEPDDFASPGYFATNLTNDVRVELTATRRAALHRYTFPSNITHPRIVVDITNDGQVSGMTSTVYLDPEKALIHGGATFSNSFGEGTYKAYTCVTFSGEGNSTGKTKEHGIWKYTQYPKLGLTNVTQTWGELGAMFTFEPSPDDQPTIILAKVGVSFNSTTQACANAEEEIPDFDFDRVHRENRAQWNDLLGRVQVDPTGVPLETLELFYSSLYRSHISPADYTGENPNWLSTEPYYDSFYCNWDTYRTLYPLMSLHDPIIFAQIVRGMIDIQKHEGWLPECRGATLKQLIQGGSNADPILGEFFVKFHEYANLLNVSASDLYISLLADAEVQPLNWDVQGRQVKVWKQYGYIPTDLYEPGGTNTRYVSRSLEYAFDDFTISQVARLLNITDDVEKYRKTASNFVQNWDPSIYFPNHTEITGMMQARKSDDGGGIFVFTDPRHCSARDPHHSTCYFDGGNTDGFYEGSPIVYSQYVPHDTAQLINLQGGPEKFKQRLDYIFEEGYFDSTNEPSQQMPFMYHYVDKPGLSTERSRKVLAEFFNTSKNGLPGNDDSGAMASYVAYYLLGMYPLPATRQTLISSPHFREVSFYNPLYGTTTRIVAKEFKGNPVDGAGGHIFVQNVTVNGQPYKSNCYLDWEVFEQGSLVELTLTDNVNVTCGNGDSALPPSMSTGGYD